MYTDSSSGPLINEVEAAKSLNISLTTVQRWRREGKGPAYRKLNKTVRYRRSDIEDFVASARRTSTKGGAQ